MRRYLLDSGIASDYISRRFGVYERTRTQVLGGDRVGIGTPVLGELLGGIRKSQTRRYNEQRLRKGLADFRIWPYDKPAAEEYGRLYAELQRIGRPMQQIDIQIAAIAQALGNCTVVTKDSDFEAIAGLAIVDWSKA